MAKGLLSVRVEGLHDAEQLPAELDAARVVFPRRLAVALTQDLQARTRGQIASEDQIVGRVLPGGVIHVGTEGSKSARALEEGATILPAKGRRGATGRPGALRFVVDGRVIFARRVLIARNRPGGKPFTRALRHRQKVAERVWEEVMDTDA